MEIEKKKLKKFQALSGEWFYGIPVQYYNETIDDSEPVAVAVPIPEGPLTLSDTLNGDIHAAEQYQEVLKEVDASVEEEKQRLIAKKEALLAELKALESAE